MQIKHRGIPKDNSSTLALPEEVFIAFIYRCLRIGVFMFIAIHIPINMHDYLLFSGFAYLLIARCKILFWDV